MAIFLKINNPDIVLINETVLNESHNVEFRNYTFIRTNKVPKSPGRGTGILIKRPHQHEVLNTAPWNLTTIETTAILVKTTNNPIFIIAAYRFHNNNARLDTNDLDKILTEFENSHASHLIIGGDFNAKHAHWGNTSNCTNETDLLNWATINNLRIISSLEPTFYRNEV